MPIQVDENLTHILSVNPDSVTSDTIDYTTIFSHPIKERSYNDTSGNNCHLFCRSQVVAWLEDSNKTFVTTLMRKDLESILQQMDWNECFYFRLIKY